ncbi:type II toxin-antitoxin system ParD family antitoxin [Candidatus Woesearchaeota archaeon]|nr:type II toxin-antitoxin system ParD family antitoxin [Candidatus Woesearchaeota archaeon]
MPMQMTQVRLTKGLIDKIDGLVQKGYYPNKSDAIRDAVRRLVWEKEISTIPNTGDSVQEVREIREKLSKEKFALKDINSL